MILVLSMIRVVIKVGIVLWLRVRIRSKIRRVISFLIFLGVL